MRSATRVLCVGLLLFAIGGAPSTVATSNAQATLASATIDPTQMGNTISPTFMGFSHEWDVGPPFRGVAAFLMGSPASGTNPIYRQLIQNLLAYGAGPFVVRVGGNSAELTGEPSGPGVVSPFAQLATDIGAVFILDLNLGSNDPKLAADQAAAYMQGMPPGSVLGLEIGNEPEYYKDNKRRPSNYGFPQWLKDFATWRAAILQRVPAGTKVIGPAWGSLSLTQQMPSLLNQEAANLAMVSQHIYGGTACNTTNPQDYLLSATASDTAAKGTAGNVALVHQRGLAYRVDEMNSISCGGQAGVSDVFASALWAVDELFHLVGVGVDGVNFHMGNTDAYSLFTFTSSSDADGTITYSVESIRPQYYGLVFFQQAAPAGAHLVPVSLNTSANVRIWATQDASGNLRVSVLNKDESASGTVSIQVPGYGDGTLTRLLAPGVGAKTGITLAGQAFDGSQDGTIQGDPISESVPAGDAYVFDMPTVSGALLVLPRLGG